MNVEDNSGVSRIAPVVWCGRAFLVKVFTVLSECCRIVKWLAVEFDLGVFIIDFAVFFWCCR